MTKVTIKIEPSQAINDVLVERVRQLSEEGFDAKHDDQHTDGELSRAAACYAMGAVETMTGREPMTWDDDFLSALWPWDRSWWKSKTARKDLVRAAALILAELERIDRASAPSGWVYAEFSHRRLHYRWRNRGMKFKKLQEGTCIKCGGVFRHYKHCPDWKRSTYAPSGETKHG